jgi:recombination protein RecA
MKAAFSKAEFESNLISRFGGVIRPVDKCPIQVITTGISEVDTLTEGLPRGAITEIFGPASAGKTTLVLSIIAEATRREEVCAFVDTTDAFDPVSASTAGIFLDQLLWIRCNSKLEHAFKATDLLLQGGGFSLILLDLGDVPAVDARRIISSWWYRFRRVVENTATAFIVVAQDSCVRSCASVTLQMKRESEIWSSVKTSSSSLEASSSFSNRNFSITGSPKSKVYSPLVTQPQPTHGNLLVDQQLRIERQKPVHSGKRMATFRAAYQQISFDNFR